MQRNNATVCALLLLQPLNYKKKEMASLEACPSVFPSVI